MTNATTPTPQPAPTPGYDATGVRTFQIGRLRCVALQDGSKVVPSAAEMGLVTPTADEVAEAMAAFGADTGLDPASVSYTILLLEIDGRRVLVDAGNGPSVLGGLLPARLADVGLTPDDIDAIILTHAHTDHIDGLLVDGVAVFPRATLHLSDVEWARAQAEDLAGADASIRERLLPLAAQVRTFAWGDEVLPGVTAVAAPGHTPGMTALRIESDGVTLLHTADALARCVQLARTDWYLPFDSDPRLAMATRRRLFAEAAQAGWLVQSYHLPFPGLGTLHAIDGSADAYRWQPYAEGASTSPS